MRVVLAGGGVGGLTAALALDPSIEITVLEQASELGEVGAGLQLGPNATRVLERIGLGEALAAIAFEPLANEVREAATGRVLLRQPLKSLARDRWGAPYLHVHRADLLGLLAEAAARRPNVSLKLCARLDGLVVGDGGVEVRVADGQTLEADALIGCDGLRSAVRSALWGAGSPRFTGQTAWRGTVDAGRLAEGTIPPLTTIWTGKGRHFVHYYVRGGTLVNFVGVVEHADGAEESWTQRGDREALMRDFDGWPAQVQSLIQACDQPWRWALYDRPPLARWSKGAASLLGDAAHPMLPSFAQGASQAIEDAEALGRRLVPGADPARALADYEAERRDRTARVQALSRRNAWLFHLGGATRPLFAAEGFWSGLTMSDPAARFDWLYGYGR